MDNSQQDDLSSPFWPSLAGLGLSMFSNDPPSSPLHAVEELGQDSVELQETDSESDWLGTMIHDWVLPDGSINDNKMNFLSGNFSAMMQEEENTDEEREEEEEEEELIEVQKVREEEMNSHDGNGLSEGPGMAMMKEEETDEEEKVELEGEKEEERGTNSHDVNAFLVDTDIIRQSSLGEQAPDLQSLGLSILNQDDFEQRVMEQVDQQLEKESEEQRNNFFSKEMAGIDEDIRQTEQELVQIKKAKQGLSQTLKTSSNAMHTYRSIMLKEENKQKQLKRLQARKRALIAKWTAAEKGEGEGPLVRRKETEKERLIRLGEITPFEMPVAHAHACTTQPPQPQPSTSQLTDFDKYMLSAMDRKKKGKPLRAQQRSSATKEEKEVLELKDQIAAAKLRLQHRHDQVHGKPTHTEALLAQARHERRHKHPRLESGSTRDDYPSEDEEHDIEDDGSDEEYVPSKEEWRSSRREERVVKKVSKKRKRGNGHPKAALPRMSSTEDETGPPQEGLVKRDRSIQKERDDADDDAYNKRLRALQGKESIEDKVEMAFDEQFDGGLRVPASLWEKLFSYQKTCVRWLWELHQQDVGGIMGDDMGMGKTIQVIVFLASLRHSQLEDSNFRRYKGLGPVIVVCPATVMDQWVKEFHKWAPSFRVAKLHSTSSLNSTKAELMSSIVRSRGVLVTSYGTLLKQQKLLPEYNWHYIILDEGHKIRNPNAQVTIACKMFKTPHRLIMSGSPIQNNLKELWSLFDFISPGKLGTLASFRELFCEPITQGGYTNASKLQVETAYMRATLLRNSISPYLLRRLKSDVKDVINLPKKNEQVLFCKLTEEQQEVYMEFLNSKECQAILNFRTKSFPGLMKMRKISNHPDLCTGGPKE